MAYADRSTGGSRIVSIVIVSIVVAVLAYGFVNGLTFSYVKKMTEKLNTFDVVEPPPPPPETPPPPPPEQPQLQTPPVVSPPPIVRVQSATPAGRFAGDDSAAVAAGSARRSASAGFPARTADDQQGCSAEGNPADWFSNDDYPSDALNAEAQGTSRIKWDIGLTGRVENCQVVQSSGNASLDRAACAAAVRRGRYTPALDAEGKPIKQYGITRGVAWRLPE